MVSRVRAEREARIGRVPSRDTAGVIKSNLMAQSSPLPPVSPITNSPPSLSCPSTTHSRSRPLPTHLPVANADMFRVILLLALAAAVAFAAPSGIESCPGNCNGCCPGTCSPCQFCSCTPCCSGGNASATSQVVTVVPGIKNVVIKSPGGSAQDSSVCAQVEGNKVCCGDGVININGDQCSCKDGSACSVDIRKNEKKQALVSEPASVS